MTDQHEQLLDTADEAARWFHVSPRTVRSWARRGHITRHPGDQYDLLEIADWWENHRDTRKVTRSAPSGTTAEPCATITPRDAYPDAG